MGPIAAGGGRWIKGVTDIAFRGLGHGNSSQRRWVVADSLLFFLIINSVSVRAPHFGRIRLGKNSERSEWFSQANPGT